MNKKVKYCLVLTLLFPFLNQMTFDRGGDFFGLVGYFFGFSTYTFLSLLYYLFFLFIQYVLVSISRGYNMTDEKIAEVEQEVEKNPLKNQFNWWVNLGSFWQVFFVGLVGLFIFLFPYWVLFEFILPLD